MTDRLVDLDRLRTAITGRVVGPDDATYDDDRQVFYANFDRRPAAVVRVADAEDVARTVTFAAEHGLELAVRSGGHSPAGHGTADGAVVIHLGDMDRVEIDAERRTAWAETGALAGAYTRAAAAHGLATGFGDTGSVGIGGITLAGGIGFLIRKHGLTIDNVLAAEVVTADGRILRADAEENPDLFWAIRGGGGNFGVVTRIRYRLVEASDIVGGMLVLPATPETITGFAAEAEAAPEELSAIANVMKAPPLPFLPEAVHGKFVVVALMAFAGDLERGQAVVDRFRALGEPLADMVGPTTYASLFDEPEGADEYHPMATGVSLFADCFGEAEATTAIRHIEASTTALAAVQFRVLGGAAARVPNDATAFAHRDRKLMVNVAAMYTDPAEEEPATAWTREAAEALHPGETSGYIGFLSDEGARGPRRAFPGETWARLQEIKRRYDPDNVFHLNHNVPPVDGLEGRRAA